MLQIQGPLVLHKVYFDEYSNFDPCKTSWQDSVKIADSFHTHFDAFTTFDTVVTPQMFLSSSFNDC